ncbi:MAG: LPS export ABC transporter periplasmic protein LptC [Gammaproteobacteria bacterium RIFCSPHIGHO2_12_FULL_43_28]|nr:MAG: LPS export ABC transporter periplasmic protein LptC [Gammaproteobacteria bacterium RIFCSPHIGHO2_12_FULL_43_28]
MTYKNSLIMLAIVAIAGFATWMTLSYRPQNGKAFTEKNVPDTLMEGVTAIIMNKEGTLDMKIETPKMVHYTENDTTNLLQPSITLYRKSPEPWHITSRFAKATQGIDNINFWENVVISHLADEHDPFTEIQTTTLMVYPHDQKATTDAPIKLIQPNLIVNAIGMRADMNTGDINLLSQTRGEYVPNS